MRLPEDHHKVRSAVTRHTDPSYSNSENLGVLPQLSLSTVGGLAGLSETARGKCAKLETISTDPQNARQPFHGPMGFDTDVLGLDQNRRSSSKVAREIIEGISYERVRHQPERVYVRRTPELPAVTQTNVGGEIPALFGSAPSNPSSKQ